METEDWSSGILSNSGNEKPDMLLYFIIGLDGELNYSNHDIASTKVCCRHVTDQMANLSTNKIKKRLK